MDCKIVVLGAGGVGKTALVIQTYDPTIEDLYRGRAVIDNQPCVLEVLDTAGQREYNALRDRWISGGEAFIIVYSISSRSTFERVKEFRDQILHVKNSDKVPIILVGNKSDKEYEREVTREEGIYMGRELGCEFIETSAKKCINVDKSFHTVVRTLIRMRSGRENKKTVSPKKDRIKFFKTSKDPIHLYDYKSFSNSVVIDDGAFGTISRAFSRKHNKLVVLKSVDLKHFTLEQLDNELKLHFKAKLHDNILGFYGITKEEMIKENYMLVLEYANEGNLRNYLKSNFKRMDWNIKLKFSKQIVSALMHLHSNDIVHRDLHSKNILIHNGNIKICDFGTAKSIFDPTIEASKTIGTILYSDPEYLKDPNKYSRDKKSDIYSIGVLLWEISSGRKPFIDKSEELRILLFNIIFGARETIVKGTPIKYAEIYKACWKENPNLRPDITQVMKDLNNLDLNDTIEDIDKYYNENGGNNQFDFNLTGQNNNVLQSDDLSSSKDISSLILERINSLERQLGNFGDPKSNQDDENISYKNGDTKSNQDYENISYKKSRCKCVVL